MMLQLLNPFDHEIAARHLTWSAIPLMKDSEGVLYCILADDSWVLSTVKDNLKRVRKTADLQETFISLLIDKTGTSAELYRETHVPVYTIESLLEKRTKLSSKIAYQLLLNLPRQNNLNPNIIEDLEGEDDSDHWDS